MDALRPHTQLLWQGSRRRTSGGSCAISGPGGSPSPPHRAVGRGADAAGRGGASADRERPARADRAGSDGLRAIWRPRARSLAAAQVQRVINCSGPETDPERIEDPLVGQLIGAGLARPDPYRLGLHATTQGALIDRDGRPSRRLFGVGPIVRGRFGRSSRCPRSGPRRSRLRSPRWRQPAGAQASLAVA